MLDATQSQAERLLSRRPEVETLAREWRVVEDVLAGSPALRTEEYLPRHSAECGEEYRKRLRLTPVFAETPALLQARQGALFRQPPQIALPEALHYLFTQATLGGATLYDVLARAAELCQSQGFCGVLLDRAPLPADLAGADGAPARAVSAAEAHERGLDRVHLALYPAGQILDWAAGRDGLQWVKLVETVRRAAAWDAPPETVHTVRIVTRGEILLYEVRERPGATPGGGYEVGAPDRIRHGARDAAGRPVVPFRFFHPFPARDGLGRPILKGAAEADAAALWVLSELLWFAYMMCPLLTFTSDRDENEIRDLAIGAARFIPLKGRGASGEEEKLAFVPLDSTALDRLLAVWERLVAKAKEAGGRAAAAAVAQAVEQSGVSKAWSFKTGEERILFLLAQNLQSGFQGLLELAARMTAGDGTAGDRGQATSDGGVVAGRPSPVAAVSVRFPDSFDLAGTAEGVRAAAEAAEFFRAQGIHAAVTPLLLKAAEAALPNLDEASWREIERQVRERAASHSEPRL